MQNQPLEIMQAQPPGQLSSIDLATLVAPFD